MRSNSSSSSSSRPNDSAPSPAARVGVPSSPAAGPPPIEVQARASRRGFTADYKLRVLSEADACRAPGEVGALLRREGLYSSLLSTWRAQSRKGSASALSDVRRGRKGASPESREIERLQSELARSNRRLKRAELLLEIQKKVSEILGVPLNPRRRGGSAS